MNNTLVVLVVIALAIGLAVYFLALPPKPGPAATAPNNMAPSWSPDGARIAFSSDRDGDWEVYMLHVDSLEATRVTDNNATDWDPSWAPGGDLIAFVSNRDAKSSKGYDIYTIQPLEKSVTRLTFRPYGWDGDPSWTPTAVVGETSDFVVFASDRDGNLEIYKLTISDGSVTRLTYREQNPDIEPTLSPDGTKIAFQSRVEGNWEVFVMDVDGRNVKRLTFNPANDRFPAWSPDGNKIAFATSRDGNDEIYVMDVDGKNKKNLTNNPGNDADPTWSPDSAMVAFQSDRTGSIEIWRMSSADGTDQKQLTGLE